MNRAVRSYVRVYLLLALLWSLGWAIYIMAGYYHVWATTGLEVQGMGNRIAGGIAVGVLVLVVVMVGAWRWRVTGESRAAVTAATVQTPVEADPRPETLELRGVGIRLDVWAQTDIWHFLKDQKDAYRGILSTNPQDYPNNPTWVSDKTTRGLGAAFKYAASEGVERWPIPVIIFGPSRAPDRTTNTAGYIASNRQQVGMGQHLFVWVQAANVDNPQAQLDYLFDFFAANPTVPAVLIYGMDGMALRTWFGDTELPQGQYVPSQFDAMVGLLVARTDRVDRYMRPFVTDDPEGANKFDKQYDTIKLWNAFWHYNDVVIAKDDTGMPEYKAWQAQLPELWKTLSNKGPGDFKPDDWFPVRWSRWQLKQFDNAPLLGYLHRPIAIDLRDEQGKRLRGVARTEVLQTGWNKLQAQLPQGKKIERLFFDSHDDKARLLQILQALDATGYVNPGEIDQGFDLDSRIGNLGMMGPMVAIALSAMASYELDGGSVTANLTSDDKLHLILVTPPSAQEKQANTEQRHLQADPFLHRVPSL